eukprot:7122138-Lingulodinium_polyedra.AAC.1
MHVVSVANCAQGLKVVGRMFRRPPPSDRGPFSRRWRRCVCGIWRRTCERVGRGPATGHPGGRPGRPGRG